MFTLSLGAGIAGMFPIVLSLVLVKYYTPENFGALAFFVSSYSILSVLVTGRYELAIIVPKSKKIAINLLVISVTLATFICSFLILFIAVFKSELLNYFGAEILGQTVFLIPVAVWLTAVYQSVFYYANREKKFKLMSGSKIVQNGTIGIAQLILGVLGSTGMGLIVGRIIGLVAGSGNMLMFTIRSISEENFATTKDELKQTAKEYKKFPGFMLPSHGMSSIYNQFPVFFITKIYGEASTGFYAIANQWLSIPNVLVARSMGDVFRQRAMEDFQSKGRFDSLLKKTLKTTLSISIIPFVIAYFSAPLLFEWFYGEEWMEAGFIAQILIISTFFSFIVTPIDSSALVIGNTGYIFRWHLSNLIFQSLNMVICYYFKLDIFYFLYGFTFIRIGHYLAEGYFCYRFSLGSNGS